MKIDNIEYSSIANDLWVDDLGNKFYYSFELGDISIDGVLDYSDKKWNVAMKLAVAKTTVSKLKNEQKQLIISNAIFTFDILVNKAYKLTQKANFVEIDYYEKYIKSFIGKKDIKEINSFDIKEIFDYQYDNGFKLSSLSITFDFLNSMLGLAILSDLIMENPCNSFNIQVIKENTYIKTIKDKLNEIYNVAAIVFKDEPLYLAFILFILHGRRKKDMFILRWELIDFEHNRLKIKSNRRKHYYLHPSIKEELLKVKKSYGFIYKSEIEVIDEPVESIKEQFYRLNQYIPDFSLTNMEYLVEQLQERQVFGDEYSSYKPTTKSKSKPYKKQKQIVRTQTIKPSLNIGKFRKKPS
ncbi:MAG: hypothetical protein KAJ49_01330 [Arcobacteraceae bacterium]|nr:hypothetical protein [Arcobacteraceae bacterium]